jgi:hypothetical protein
MPYTQRPTRLCRTRLMQSMRSRITPFRCFLALLLVLLEARDVLVGEEEAVAGEAGGADELENRGAEGYGTHDVENLLIWDLKMMI